MRQLYKSAHFSNREGGRVCSGEIAEARFSSRATGESCLIKGKMTSEEGRERRNELQRLQSCSSGQRGETVFSTPR